FLVSCFIRRSHLTSTLFPYTTLFRSAGLALLICFSFLNQTQHLHDLLTKKRIEQSKLELDVFLALCTNRNVLDLAADSFFDHLDVVHRCFWQVFRFSALADVAVPAINIFDHWFCIVEVSTEWELFDLFAVNVISNANWNLLEAGQNIQLGQSDFVSALYTNTVAGSRNIERTNTSWTAG